MPYHVAAEETLDRSELQRLQRRKLSHLLQEVQASNTFYRRKLQGLEFDAAVDPIDRLPFTTRSELQQDQLDHPPYGTNLTYRPEHYHRLHETSGSQGTPLRWLDTRESWDWWKSCWAVIYRAAGIDDFDRFLLPFSFGPFIGFWGAFEAATALGNFCLPCGSMSTKARLGHMLTHNATVVCCTPTYALHMAEVAATEGIRLSDSTVRALIVAGEPGGNIPATRLRIESAWGARVFDHAGMTEAGPWGFECLEAPGGLHVMENEFIAEVIDPASLKPVRDGEAGELVLTNLGRTGSPLIRYRTGDRVTLTRGRCACGRWFARAEGGIVGRLDDMFVVRGNNVFPAAVEGIVREFDAVTEFRLEVDETSAMADLRIQVEPATGFADDGLADRIAQSVSDRLHFRPHVDLVEPGALPRCELKGQRLVRRTGPTAS